MGGNLIRGFASIAGKGIIMLGFKKWAGRASALTAVTAAATLALGGLAFADTLQDTIDDTGTGVSLVAGSLTSGTAAIRLIGNNAAGDPDPGCNIDAGESALRLDIVTPTGVTANPDPLSITSCGTEFSVSFTASSAAVSGRATVVVLSGPAGGGTYVNQVDIPITVTQPANTAPVVSVTGVTNNATYEKSSVPQSGCSVVDAEDTGESANPQISNGAYDALGSHTVTCSYTDGGNITRSDTKTYTVVRDTDITAPVAGYTLTPPTPDGDNGWYTGDVTLNWTVTENESPETLTTTGCVDQSITADQAPTTYRCSATSEGGTGSESVTIKRDGTAPVVSYDGVVSGTAGANGWYTSDVTVKFTATDALSGPESASQSASTSGDGAALTVRSPSFSDEAGNTTAAGDQTSPAFKIDMTGPTTPTFSGGPGSSYYFGSDPAAPTCNSSDSTSGLASCVVTGGGSTVGEHSYTATATDNAGNKSTASHTYTVLSWATRGYFNPVDMGGVWNTVKGGNTVPLKFEVFAGTTELTGTSAVRSFVAKSVACPGSSAVVDEIETVLTGGTNLRYDSTGGQFIQNWQTPKKPGTCAQAITTMQDGSVITANFMFR